MRIDKLTSEHRNDFSAVLICEHCAHKQTITTGYHDNHYHTKVIPAITCHLCLKNRAGETANVNPQGVIPVH